MGLTGTVSNLDRSWLRTLTLRKLSPSPDARAWNLLKVPSQRDSSRRQGGTPKEKGTDLGLGVAKVISCVAFP